jgi:hypothetical protein
LEFIDKWAINRSGLCIHRFSYVSTAPRIWGFADLHIYWLSAAKNSLFQLFDAEIRQNCLVAQI